MGILVRDFLERYDADALRFFLAVAGPENQDTDFTWAEFVRRNNDELVAKWGNLVNRALALSYRHFGAVPEPGPLTPEDEEIIAAVEAGFDTVGELIGAARFRASITEAMRLADRVNQYASDQAPWATIKTDRERAATVLYVLLRAVDNLKIIFTPFLPFSSQTLHELLGYEGWIAGPLEFRDRRGGRRLAPGADRRLCVLDRPVGAERAAARPDAGRAEAALPQARSGAGAARRARGVGA